MLDQSDQVLAALIGGSDADSDPERTTSEAAAILCAR
jgi:hypothetical protein